MQLCKAARGRNVTLSVPKFYGVARSIAQINLIGVLPSRFATALAERFGIACCRVPHELTLARQFLYATLRRRIIAGCGSRSSALEPLDELRHPLRPEEGKARRPQPTLEAGGRHTIIGPPAASEA